MTMKKIFVLLLFLPLAVFCTGMDSFQEAQRGAEQGSMLHQYVLAEYYAKGTGGVTPDLAKAAERGYPHAYYSLGLCYYDGRGVEKNRKLAMKWIRRAAEAGVPEAQNFLDISRKIGL